jgi:rifampicin phosphotransferase
MITTKYIQPLPDCSPDNAERVGGKAIGLGALLRNRLPVPDGFAVTTDAYRDYLNACGLAATISEILDGADSAAQISKASEQLRGLFDYSVLADDIAEQIAAAYRSLGEDVPVAVRSSATAEDTAEASFAGQQDTYLWIRGADEVKRHVVQCWASLFTPQAIGYRRRFDVPVENLAMGVVVQQMVPADVAGVMMTIDPTTGDDSTIYIAAAYGLGEGVVKGDVASDSYWMDKASLQTRTQDVATKEQAHRFDPEHGQVRLADVAQAERDQPALAPADLAALAQIGKDVEAAFGCAQDLEWALVRRDGGSEIFMLQSRPETVWSQRDSDSEPPAEKINLLHAPTRPDATWSTTNLAESIPGVPTPLGWSVWYPAGELAMRRTFNTIGALSSQEAVLPDRSEDSLIGIFYGHTSIRVDLLCSWAERIPGTDSAAMAQQTFSAVPEGYVSRAQRRYYPRVAARSLTPFVKGPRLILEDHKRVERTYAEAMRVLPTASDDICRRWLFDGAAMWSESLYRQALVTLGTVQPASDMLIRLADLAGVSGHELMAGYGGHLETQTVSDAWACSRRELDIDTFIARHGYHGWRSGEISSKVWREDRTPVLELVDQYRAKSDDANPAIGERERRERRAQLEAEFLAGLPAHRRLQGRLALKMAARYVPLRGVGKVSFLRGVDIVRGAARRLGENLAAAGVFADAEDIFFTTIEEHRAGLPANIAELIAERRRIRQRYEAMAIPQSFRGIPPIVRPHIDDNAVAIQGTGASPGVVVGLARVVTSPAEACIEEGEILVAHDTDPGWASMMFLSSGLVADIGGIMSHTAVVARELGIPCIVNTKHASRSLNTGDKIMIDGASGSIEILERSAAAANE